MTDSVDISQQIPINILDVSQPICGYSLMLIEIKYKYGHEKEQKILKVLLTLNNPIGLYGEIIGFNKEMRPLYNIKSEVYQYISNEIHEVTYEKPRIDNDLPILRHGECFDQLRDSYSVVHQVLSILRPYGKCEKWDEFKQTEIYQPIRMESPICLEMDNHIYMWVSVKFVNQSDNSEEHSMTIYLKFKEEYKFSNTSGQVLEYSQVFGVNSVIYTDLLTKLLDTSNLNMFNFSNHVERRLSQYGTSYFMSHNV